MAPGGGFPEGIVKVMGVVRFPMASGLPEAVVNSRRATPELTACVSFPPHEYGSKLTLWKTEATPARVSFAETLRPKRPLGMGAKEVGEPGTVMLDEKSFEAFPAEDSETESWMFVVARPMGASSGAESWPERDPARELRIPGTRALVGHAETPPVDCSSARRRDGDARSSCSDCTRESRTPITAWPAVGETIPPAPAMATVELRAALRVAEVTCPGTDTIDRSVCATVSAPVVEDVAAPDDTTLVTVSTSAVRVAVS